MYSVAPVPTLLVWVRARLEFWLWWSSFFTRKWFLLICGGFYFTSFVRRQLEFFEFWWKFTRNRQVLDRSAIWGKVGSFCCFPCGAVGAFAAAPSHSDPFHRWIAREAWPCEMQRRYAVDYFRRRQLVPQHLQKPFTVSDSSLYSRKDCLSTAGDICHKSSGNGALRCFCWVWGCALQSWRGYPDWFVCG